MLIAFKNVLTNLFARINLLYSEPYVYLSSFYMYASRLQKRRTKTMVLISRSSWKPS